MDGLTHGERLNDAVEFFLEQDRESAQHFADAGGVWTVRGADAMVAALQRYDVGLTELHEAIVQSCQSMVQAGA